MKPNFLKNVIYMSSGEAYLIFISLISLPIYIYKLGLEGYAIYGLVSSFFMIVSNFDIPFFLGFLKGQKDRETQEQSFATVYLFVHIFNIFLLFIQVPLILLLVKYAYQRPDYYILYIIGLALFMFLRFNKILICFYRSIGKEKVLQRAFVPSRLLGFLFTILFLFVFELGVISIFLGLLSYQLMTYIMLMKSLKRYILFKYSFSIVLFKKIFRKYSAVELLLKWFIVFSYEGIIFFCSLFVGPSLLGVITLFIHVLEKLGMLLNSLFIYTCRFFQENIGRLKRTFAFSKSLIFISTVFHLLCLVSLFLLLLAASSYSLLQFDYTIAFIILISGKTLFISEFIFSSYLFVSKANRLMLLHLIIDPLYVFLSLYLIIHFGILAFSIIYLLRQALFFILFVGHYAKDISLGLDARTFKFYIVASLLTVSSWLILLFPEYLLFSILALVLISVVFLFLHNKQIIGALKEISSI